MKTFLLLILVTSVTCAEERKSFTQIREERREFFGENPKEGLRDFDETELDLLYQDLPRLPILDLYLKYPELTPRELEELQTKRK